VELVESEPVAKSNDHVCDKSEGKKPRAAVQGRRSFPSQITSVNCFSLDALSIFLLCTLQNLVPLSLPSRCRLSVSSSRRNWLLPLRRFHDVVTPD